MKFFRELYDFTYNYIKECSSVMRYINKFILKGGVKCVSLLLAISIDFDHFFFYACRCISRVDLEESEGYS